MATWLPGREPVPAEVPVVINVHTVALVLFSSLFPLNILTKVSLNHFNWKMGNVKKSWVCDQKGILTFFTTKKLEAIIINILFSDLM